MKMTSFSTALTTDGNIAIRQAMTDGSSATVELHPVQLSAIHDEFFPPGLSATELRGLIAVMDRTATTATELSNLYSDTCHDPDAVLARRVNKLMQEVVALIRPEKSHHPPAALAAHAHV